MTLTSLRLGLRRLGGRALLGLGHGSFADAFTRADGALGSPWTGATFAIATNKAVNTPTLGADVIVNGAFAADTDWTKGAGWTIAAGVATGTATSADLTAAVAPLTQYIWYQVAWTVTGYVDGLLYPVFSTSDGGFSGDGTITRSGRASSTSFLLRSSTWTGNADNVSAKVLTLSELFASLTASTPDVLADVKVTGPTATAGIQAGLVLNLDSAATPANFVIAYLDGVGNAKLDKCVAGVYTNVISAAVTYSAGATLRVIKNGTSYGLFYNGAAVGSTSTINNAGIINNTLHGLFSTSALNSLDNFSLS